VQVALPLAPSSARASGEGALDQAREVVVAFIERFDYGNTNGLGHLIVIGENADSSHTVSMPR
jgi:hypothetical protein